MSDVDYVYTVLLNNLAAATADYEKDKSTKSTWETSKRIVELYKERFKKVRKIELADDVHSAAAKENVHTDTINSQLWDDAKKTKHSSDMASKTR
jgi:hypothetical protein